MRRHNRRRAREAEHEAPASDLDQILVALQGKSKAEGKGKKEDSECYNRGKVGHLARDGWSERQPKGSGKDGKNKGKGKDRAVYNLAGDEAEEHDDSGISIGCLVCAPAEAQLHACSKQAAETWRRYECIEAL